MYVLFSSYQQIYDWLYKICHDNNIETKNMKLIHKLLFTQRIKAHDGEFFNSIAIQIGKILGQIQEVSLFNLCYCIHITIK